MYLYEVEVRVCQPISHHLITFISFDELTMIRAGPMMTVRRLQLACPNYAKDLVSHVNIEGSDVFDVTILQAGEPRRNSRPTLTTARTVCVIPAL